VEDRKFICPCYRHKGDIADTGHCICHLFVSDDYQPSEMDLPPVVVEGGPMPDIVVYGAIWCSDTRRTISFLNQHGIRYAFVDVDKDAEAAEKVKRWNGGFLSTPTLDLQGRAVTEPSDEELAELVGIAPRGPAV
jgi:glutaredoxin